MKRLLIVLSVFLTGTAAMASGTEVLIFGGQDQDEFLGCLTCDETAPSSVWNEYSQHGWANGFGTWNTYGPHASAYFPNSACNEYAANPPILTDRAGNLYGYLSTNEYKSRGVCSVTGNPQICRALRAMCATE
jgi:hypothetical protein